MTSRTDYAFYGDMQHRSANPHKFAPEKPEPYLAAEPLVRAVNLAIHLGRPLLLEGEAGCGKTRLARAVAYELGLPFFSWAVRSTSKAQDGLYSYDAIGRMHDAQIARFLHEDLSRRHGDTESGQERKGEEESNSHNKVLRDPAQPSNYVSLGAMGKAFMSRECPAVVLVDEIDKADLDFPNDLLTVLDEPWSFDIIEVGKSVVADTENRPIVIMTSNREKGDLPAPFLRRCIYFFVQFPDSEERLRDIVNVHYGQRGIEPPPDSITNKAIKRFLELRQDKSLHKKPGTSEFLDWLESLYTFRPPVGKAMSLADEGQLPYPEALIKLRADWQRLRL